MMQTFNIFKCYIGGFLIGLSAGQCALADPITHVRTESKIDWTSAGVGGVGAGSGTINLAGVSGTVKLAFLYWHGIDQRANSGDGNYDNPTVSINGTPVTGTTIGTANTNCWGPGNSVAYRADVTSIVAGTGNGAYNLSGLSAKPGHNANGASLVVIYDDGNPANNRDLAFFEGNDSSIPDFFPGEDFGWHANLQPINYTGGPVSIQFHVADGQSASDGDVKIATSNGSLLIPDSPLLWDGKSVPSAGTGRDGALYDIHTINVTSAFGGIPDAAASLKLDSQANGECLGLILGLIDLEPGSAPPPRNDIDLTPDSAENCTAEPHTITATLNDSNNTPIVGKAVRFTVITGPNIGLTSDQVSNASGEAFWTYTSTAAGKDQIEGCFTNDRGITKCDIVEKTWKVCNTPPDCSAGRATLQCLWTPNHNFSPIGIQGVTDIDNDPVSIKIDSVTSDEKTAVELGAGGVVHGPDATNLGESIVNIRAERSGLGDGRVYGLNFTADDGNGGQCKGTAFVKVPRDNSNKRLCPAVDSGQRYNAAQ